jgi:hypothetical protein
MITRQLIMIVLVIVIGVMILNDFSLHLVELLGVERYHPFYGFFWSFPSREAYTIFWTVYWSVALVLALILGTLLFADLRRDTKHQKD